MGPLKSPYWALLWYLFMKPLGTNLILRTKPINHTSLFLKCAPDMLCLMQKPCKAKKDSKLFSSFLQLTQWHAVRLRECASIFNYRSSYTGTQKAEFFEKHQGCSEMKSEGGDYVDSWSHFQVCPSGGSVNSLVFTCGWMVHCKFIFLIKILSLSMRVAPILFQQIMIHTHVHTCTRTVYC